MKNTTYTPVDPDFIDTITIEKNKSDDLKIHYFNNNNEWKSEHAPFHSIDKKNDGDYLVLNNSFEVRLDRIISINGKPGPAHEEFDSYANACMDCSGGYDNL